MIKLEIMMSYLMKLLPLCLLLMGHAAGAADNVILMRHALAPGVGDPAQFQIDDCTTQRNLSQEGIEQARDIGQSLIAKGLVPTKIYTSPWCRCIDTAQALDLGPYEIHPGLSSFFEGHVDRDETLRLLRAELQNIGQDELVLFVTHQVVIQAMTGRYVKSGEYLIVDSTQF